MTFRRHLVRSSIGAFTVKVAGRGSGLITAIVLTRLLGAEEFGIYAFAMAMAEVVTPIAACGLPPLLVREVAAGITRGDYATVRGLLRRSWQSALLVSGSLSVLIGGIMTLAGDMTPTVSLDLIWLAMGLLVPLVVKRIGNSVLRGLHHIVKSQLIPESQPMIFLGLVGIAAWAPFTTVDSRLALVLQITAAVFVGLVLVATVRWAMPRTVWEQAPTFHTKTWLASAKPFMLTAAVHKLLRQSPILLLGIMAQPEMVGYFRIAERGAELIMLAVVPVRMSVGPVYASMHVANQHKYLQRLAKRSGQGILLAAVPLALVLVLGADWLVPWVFGADFEGAIPLLRILVLAYLVIAVDGTVHQLLIMTGHERLNARATVIGCVACIGLNLALIPLWSAMGAAVATTLAFIVWKALAIYWARRHLGIRPTGLGL